MNTRFFGAINVAEEKIINFGEGLPGFEDKHKFTILSNYDTKEPVPFMWLQSLDDSDLAFVLTIPYFVDANYDVDIPEEFIGDLNISSQEDVGIYSIVKIKDKLDDMTCNLMSPIIINTRNMKAKQVTLFDANYSSREKFQ